MKKTLRQFLSVADNIDNMKKLCGDMNVDNTFMFKTMKISCIIDREYKKIKDMIQPSKQYLEYESERKKLLFSRAVYSLDKKMLYVSENKPYYGDGEPYVSKEVENLSERYQAVIEDHISKQNHLNEKLDEEIELEFPIIKLNTVPENLTWDTFEWLFDFIDDGEI